MQAPFAEGIWPPGIAETRSVCTRTYENRLTLRLFLHSPCRAQADVGAAKTARPVDPSDCLIGLAAGLFHAWPERRHVEHAPPRGKDAVACPAGARMKHLRACNLSGVLKAAEFRARQIGTGIAAVRQHDADRGLLAPAYGGSIEGAARDRVEDGQ